MGLDAKKPVFEVGGCEQQRHRPACASAQSDQHLLIALLNVCLFVCLFCCFTSQVNSDGHDGTVSSPNHTFAWAGLNRQLTSTSCTYFRL